MGNGEINIGKKDDERGGGRGDKIGGSEENQVSFTVPRNLSHTEDGPSTRGLYTYQVTEQSLEICLQWNSSFRRSDILYLRGRILGDHGN